MENNNMKIEQRIQNMKKFYLQVDKMIQELPDTIPDSVKSMLKNSILGDTELKDLINGIDSHRPPRIFLIGRTGVGKSSLINALCSAYVARVGDIRSCTDGAYTHVCRDKDRVLMEILDTRGIAESDSLDDRVSAEELLIKQVDEFSPDVTIFMLSCTHRDDIDKDVAFLKKITQRYSEINKIDLPIVVVINKCDEVPSARYKTPAEYPQSKIKKINETVRYYREIFHKNECHADSFVAVSSLVDWQTANGEPVSAEDIEHLSQQDIDGLQMEFDGRYQIEELLNILEKAILDSEAQMGLRMALRLEDLVEKIARHLNHIFSGISATVALTPIPVSDIYILIILQSVLVALIASLSGREVSLESAREFVVSLGGVAGAGFAFRLAAQQASKFVNVIWPGAGSAVSSVIAATGTSGIGNAAIQYYIKDKNLEEVKKAVADTKKNV